MTYTLETLQDVQHGGTTSPHLGVQAETKQELAEKVARISANLHACKIMEDGAKVGVVDFRFKPTSAQHEKYRGQIVLIFNDNSRGQDYLWAVGNGRAERMPCWWDAEQVAKQA
jgi:hypothetical protein